MRQRSKLDRLMDDLLSDEDLHALVQRAMDLPSAPQALIRDAIDLFPAPYVEEAQARRFGPVDRLCGGQTRAVLAFDSWDPPGGADRARRCGRVPDDYRQMVFRAGARDIDLQLVRSDALYSISGQASDAETPASIELVAEPDGAILSAQTRRTPLGASGEFRLDGLPGGIYRVTFLFDRVKVMLPPVIAAARVH